MCQGNYGKCRRGLAISAAATPDARSRRNNNLIVFLIGILSVVITVTYVNQF